MNNRQQIKALKQAAAALEELQESDLPDYTLRAFDSCRLLILDQLPADQQVTRRRRSRRSHLTLVTD